MSVGSAGSSSNAYSYLQSLLQQGSTKKSEAGGSADPMTALLAAFYPADGAEQPDSASPAGTASTAGATSPASSAPCPPFSPETLGTLISMQEQQSAATGSPESRAQSLFGQFDGDGDGQISKSEFETVFGPNADTSKVDGLFGALDADGDGSVSQDELTSAAQQSQGHHHRHHHVNGGVSGQTGGLADLLSAMRATGATGRTAANADGSTTTTIG